MKNTGVETQKVNWSDMKLHLLNILLMFKQINYSWLANNFILDTNKVYCEGMSLGFPIEGINETKNAATAVMGHSHFQLLTDVINIHNMSVVSSRNHRVILEKDQMASAINNLGIKPKLTGTKEVLQNMSLKGVTV